MPRLAGGAGRSRHPAPPIFIAILAVTLLAGCVERKLLIRSDPPGAEVYLDEVYRGETPLDIPFTFYRARLVEIRKDGFEPERFLQSLPIPFYQIIPLDFFFEVLVPFTLVDEHRIERRLKPESPEIYDRRFMDELRDRAGEFRKR